MSTMASGDERAAVYAVNIPLLFAFSVARYQSPER
jgi:hypothetical protein